MVHQNMGHSLTSAAGRPMYHMYVPNAVAPAPHASIAYYELTCILHVMRMRGCDYPIDNFLRDFLRRAPRHITY